MSWAEVFKTTRDLKRHLRNNNKGIPPASLKKLSVRSGNGQAKVVFSMPEDTRLEGQLVCSVKGVRILYKAGEGPIEHEEDGVFVADLEGKSLEEAATSGYIIQNLENGTLYQVAVLPYSDYNVFNRNKENQTAFYPSSVQVYGFTQNFADKNPETTITYTDDAERYSPMARNTDGSMNTQEWEDFPLLAENLPYMVRKDGTVDYQLNPNDYTKKLDGSDSDVANANYNGGAFSWLKKVYMKETYSEDGMSRTVQFAFTNKDHKTEDFKPVGFIRGGEELEGVWIPMFYMDSAGRTISGTQPIYGKGTAEERTVLQNWSANAVHLGGGIMNVIRDLLFMFARSTDIQSHFGEGCMSAYANTSPLYGVKKNAVMPGGAFYGTTGGKTLNKIFHSLVLGSYQQLTRDPQTLLSGGKLMVSKDYDLYSLTAAGYTDTGKTFATSSGWRYPSKLQMVDGFGSVPVDDNAGSSATGLCDGVYYNASGVRVARRLGSCDGGLIDGPGCLSLYYEASNANWACGVGALLLPSVGYAPA